MAALVISIVTDSASVGGGAFLADAGDWKYTNWHRDFPWLAKGHISRQVGIISRHFGKGLPS